MEQLLLQVEILWPALIAGLLVLATHVPLGREVLQRGIIFLDLAIAQIAAFGVVFANTILESHEGDPLVPVSLAAITAAIIGAMALYSLCKLEIRVQEAIIGIFFILAATGSILLLSTDPHGGERLKEILVGQILWIQPSDLIPLALATAAILASWIWLREKFGTWLFYPLFAITITLSTQVVGVYLVFASLIVPSLATLRHTKPVTKGLALGAAGYLTGLLISALFDLPAGAAIVWSLVLVALVYYATCILMKREHRTVEIE